MGSKKLADKNKENGGIVLKIKLDVKEKRMRTRAKAGKTKKVPAKVKKKGGELKKAIGMNDVYCHSEDVVARMIQGELILVPLKAGIGSIENEIYALDETGKEIWIRMDGQKTVAEIIADLEKSFQPSVRSIPSDVMGLMGELAKRRIIQVVRRP
jgi:hypothetical protein